MNNDLSVAPGHESNPRALGSALSQLERCIGHDYLVVIVSDFFGWDEESTGHYPPYQAAQRYRLRHDLRPAGEKHRKSGEVGGQ